MQELRLVGVHEDGEHLLLTGEAGTSYTLPIDDALRTASTGTPEASSAGPPAPPQEPPRQEPRQRAAKGPVHLTPRDIQARIRAGATAEQVAAESDQDLAHVQRYEGPVRAERDYVAYLAQRVEVASPLPSHDGYRSAFGDDPALLGDMVAFRIRSYGADTASLEWDSWRLPDGSWHVEASFELPEDSAVDLGEQPPAHWTYNPTRKTVANGNRWAQVLSELEPLDGPLPSRRLSAVADRVFDFEAEEQPDAPETTDADQDGLLDVLRSRRGQRLGADEDGDDALAELLTRSSMPSSPPETGTASEGVREYAVQDRADDTADTSKEPRHPAPGLSLAPRAGEEHGREEQRGDGGAEPQDGDPAVSDGAPEPQDGGSTDTREISVLAQPPRRLQAPAASEPTGDSPARRAGPDGTGRAAEKSTRKDGKDGLEAGAERKARPKRSSVPSWDDIVFGRKSD